MGPPGGAVSSLFTNGFAANQQLGSSRATPNGAPPTSRVLFIENVGQFPADIHYHLPGDHSSLSFTDTGLLLSYQEPVPPPPTPTELVHLPTLNGSGSSHTLRLTFPGSNPRPTLEPLTRLKTTVNYYLGNDPNQWHTHVPAYNGLRYVDLYPQLDLEIWGQGDHWTWQFVCKANCDHALSTVRLALKDEADTMIAWALNSASQTIALKLNDSTLPEQYLPLIPVVGSDGAAISAPTARLQGPSDPLLTPFARPNRQESPDNGSLVYSTYLGGTDGASGFDVAIDGQGQAYFAGSTGSNFLGVDHTANSGGYLLKLNATGTAIEFLTIFGGSEGDDVLDLEVSETGQSYIGGITSSTDFPGENLGPSDDSSQEIFVAQFTPTGTLDQAGVIRLFGLQIFGDLAIDQAGDIYLTGGTDTEYYQSGYKRIEFFESSAVDFCGPESSHPVFKRSIRSATYVIKVSGNRATALACAAWQTSPYSTIEYGIAITVDADGNIYVTGQGGPSYNKQAYLLQLAGGNRLGYVTYLGKSRSDYTFGEGMALDSQGNLYLVGYTSDEALLDSGTSSARQNGSIYRSTITGDNDGFLAIFPAGSSTPSYLTYLGGVGTDVAVDGQDNLYVGLGHIEAGRKGGLYRYLFGYNGSRILKLDPTATRLLDQYGLPDVTFRQFAVTPDGRLYVTGHAEKNTLPTTPGVVGPTHSGKTDAFAMAIQLQPDCELVEIISARYLNETTLGVVGFLKPEMVDGYLGEAFLTTDPNGTTGVDLLNMAFNNAPSGAITPGTNLANHDSTEIRRRGLWSAVLPVNGETATVYAKAATTASYNPNQTDVGTNCQERRYVRQVSGIAVETTKMSNVNGHLLIQGNGQLNTKANLQLLRYSANSGTNPALRASWQLEANLNLTPQWSATATVEEGENLYLVRATDGTNTVEDLDGFFVKVDGTFIPRTDGDLRNRGQALAFRNNIRSRTPVEFPEQLVAALATAEGGTFNNDIPGGIMQVTCFSGFLGQTERGFPDDPDLPADHPHRCKYEYEPTVDSIGYNVGDGLLVLEEAYRIAEVSNKDEDGDTYIIQNAAGEFDRLMTAVVFYNATSRFNIRYAAPIGTGEQTPPDRGAQHGERFYLANIATQLQHAPVGGNYLPPADGENLSVAEFLGDADYAIETDDLVARLTCGQNRVLEIIGEDTGAYPCVQ